MFWFISFQKKQTHIKKTWFWKRFIDLSGNPDICNYFNNIIWTKDIWCLQMHHWILFVSTNHKTKTLNHKMPPRVPHKMDVWMGEGRAGINPHLWDTWDCPDQHQGSAVQNDHEFPDKRYGGPWMNLKWWKSCFTETVGSQIDIARRLFTNLRRYLVLWGACP